MRRISLRLQIALLSALLTCALLGICGYSFWSINERIHINRVDRELRNLGAANLDRVFGKDHWERLEKALEFMSSPDAGRYILLVRNEKGDWVYQSPHWPKSLPSQSLPQLPAEATEPGDELDAASRLHRAPPPPRAGEPLTRNNPPLPRKKSAFVTVHAEGRHWRVGVMGNPYTTMYLGADLAEVEEGMAELREAFFIGLPLVILGIAAGSWLLAGRAWKPIRQMTRAIENVTAKGLDQRLNSKGHAGEFESLIKVFNAMLGRLEQSFLQSNRFTADAAHELRTPLTILQGEMEQALQEAPPDSAEQHRVVNLLEEIQHLKAIVEKLLLLSQADAGKLPLDLQPVDLSGLLLDVIADAEILAGGLRIDHDLAPGCIVEADPILLHQLLQNLSSNALRYNVPGGFVRFVLERHPGRFEVTVANSGPGIAESDRDKIFQRFHRADSARNRSEGTGLGLAIAREIARAHGGELELDRATADETRLRLTLPA